MENNGGFNINMGLPTTAVRDVVIEGNTVRNSDSDKVRLQHTAALLVARRKQRLCDGTAVHLEFMQSNCSFHWKPYAVHVPFVQRCSKYLPKCWYVKRSR